MMEKNIQDWNKTATEIENSVNGAWKEFRNIPEESLVTRPGTQEWSAKEIVGHLIDSAANNHQRFVRLQIKDHIRFPDYSKDNHAWVSIQKYQETPWRKLIDLWRQLNLHLARVIRYVDEKCIDHIWILDENTSIKLGDLMTDYLRHLNDHLRQIREQTHSIRNRSLP